MKDFNIIIMNFRQQWELLYLFNNKLNLC